MQIDLDIFQIWYPKLNNAPNFAGTSMIIGKNVKLNSIKQIPIPKNIAKFFQLYAAYYTSLTFEVTILFY